MMVAGTSKSPLPRFFKGGNSTARWASVFCKGRNTRLELVFAQHPLWASPFAKGGLRRICAALLVCLFLLTPITAFAQSAGNAAPLQFVDSAQERRFHTLVAELRCVMCQNQSLADSDAQIARDLRREVLALMQQGKSDEQIKTFLVARYGEFVLYRPQVDTTTWLLWFGPALLLIAGGIVVARIVHKRGGTRPADPDRADADQEW